MSQRVSYSNTVGTTGSKQGAKNNSISTCAALKSAEKHANHEYTEEEVKRLSSDIDLSLKKFNLLYECRDGKEITKVNYLELYKIVDNYYASLFNRHIEDYNEMMLLEGKPDKVIDSYIDYVSSHHKLQVAVQGIIQVGDCHLWENIAMEDRQKASEVLMKLLEVTIEQLNSTPNGRFYLAGVANHNNEHSPHQHYYGIAVGEFDDGRFLPLRISKSSVFTRETLKALQNEVREKSEDVVFREFGWLFKSKTGEKRKSLSKHAYIWLKQKQKEMSNEIEDQENPHESQTSFEPPSSTFATDSSDYAPCLERTYCPIVEDKKDSEKLDEKREEIPVSNDNYLINLLWLLDLLFNLSKREESLHDKLMREKIMKELYEMLEDNLVTCDLEDFAQEMSALSACDISAEINEPSKKAPLDDVIHKADKKQRLIGYDHTTAPGRDLMEK